MAVSKRTCAPRFLGLVVIGVLASFLGWAAPARAAAAPQAPPIPAALAASCGTGSGTGVLPSGAFALLCIPRVGWNGAVVVYAHGYVNFNEPLQLLPDGLDIPLLVLSRGLAFATTSYRQNGLAILEGADDIRELTAALAVALGPRPTFIAGASEGGLVTTLLAESPESPFSGGLAACGPIGDFRQQIDYLGDFRVLFDFYFPGLIPGEAIHIPPSVIQNWSTHYIPTITAALAANRGTVLQLLNVFGASTELLRFFPNLSLASDPVGTTLRLLRYSIFATNDAFDKLGGHSFDNRDRIYTGTGSASADATLNRHVHRFSAQKAALEALQAYETSGILTIPLVTLHTTGDDVIPYAHELLYGAKVATAGGPPLLFEIPVVAPGHCNFTAPEVPGALALLLP